MNNIADIKEIKVFITDDNMATFVCPECENIRVVNVSKYKDLEKAVKVRCKCKCGCTYNALLERRKFYRKETDLPGVFRKGKIDFSMTVKNLSRTGLRFEAKEKPTVEIGDRILVEFTLDDQERSFISKEMVVRLVDGYAVGGEFTSIDEYGKISPYLFI